MPQNSKIRTCLWFPGNGEEAASRVFNKMLEMNRIDITAIEEAFRSQKP